MLELLRVHPEEDVFKVFWVDFGEGDGLGGGLCEFAVEDGEEEVGLGGYEVFVDDVFLFLGTDCDCSDGEVFEQWADVTVL